MVDGGGESVGVAVGSSVGEESRMDGGGDEGVEVLGDEGSGKGCSGRCGNVSSSTDVEEDEEVGWGDVSAAAHSELQSNTHRFRATSSTRAWSTRVRSRRLLRSITGNHRRAEERRERAATELTGGAWRSRWDWGGERTKGLEEAAEDFVVQR